MSFSGKESQIAETRCLDRIDMALTKPLGRRVMKPTPMSSGSLGSVRPRLVRALDRFLSRVDSWVESCVKSKPPPMKPVCIWC